MAVVRKKVSRRLLKRVIKKRIARKKLATKKAIRHRIPVALMVQEKLANFTTKKKEVQDLSKISVKAAKFLHGNVLAIKFKDGTQREVDFSPFFTASTPRYLLKYKSPQFFRGFKIEEGNVVWGEDWDLIFPLPQLYSGNIKP